jgi:hypothetical protein
MASIKEAVTSLLTTRASLTSLQGGRAYDSVLPQSAPPIDNYYPAQTFQVTDHGDTRNFTGYCPEFPVQVQFDTWALNAADRAALSEATRAALQTWRGSQGGIVIVRAFKDTDFDSIEPRDDGGPLPTFRNTQRWTIRIRVPPVG